MLLASVENRAGTDFVRFPYDPAEGGAAGSAFDEVVARFRNAEPKRDPTVLRMVRRWSAIRHADLSPMQFLKYSLVGIAAGSAANTSWPGIAGAVVDALNLLEQVRHKVAHLDYLQTAVLAALNSSGGLTETELVERLNDATSAPDEIVWTKEEVAECLSELTKVQRRDGTSVPFVAKGPDSRWKALA